MYDHLGIPSLAEIFAFANTYEVLSHIHKCYIWQPNLSFTYMITYVFLVWKT